MRAECSMRSMIRRRVSGLKNGSCYQYSMYNLDSIADDSLIERLEGLVAKDSALLARLLAHIGEVDARRLYLQQGCSSMFTYCVERLNCSEGEAYKRIHAARAARKYPLIFDLVASGALHLSGVNVLAPELTE